MSSCSLSFFLFVFTYIATAFSSSSSTSESSPTINADELHSTLSFSTPYYTGGERLIGKYPENTLFYNFIKKYASLQIVKHRKTNATGIYDVLGNLWVQFPYWYGGDENGAGKTQGGLRFWLEGLWSEKSRQLLMVGSASWVVEGKPIVLDAVLDLNYTAKNDPMLYSGYISGSLKSMVSANVPGYFDPISIFRFPPLPNYNYSALSQAFGETYTSDSDVAESQWSIHEGHKYCWMIMGDFLLLEVEFAAECRKGHHHCSPLGDDGDRSIRSLPRLLLLTLIQCSASARKLRYMATFQYTRFDQGFGLNSTVIGEASWDDNKNELSGIACRLLDPLNRSADEVGDCTMRLTLRYTSIFSIQNEPKLVGGFSSSKHAEKSGYFRKIYLAKADDYDLMTPPRIRHEYTELERVARLCSGKESVKKGARYPDLQSGNLEMDMYVGNSRGEDYAWIYATPLWIGNTFYRKKNMMSVAEVEAISESHSSNTSNSNISYMITLSSSTELKFWHLFEKLNWSTNSNYEVKIAAEGVYNAETGHLCMVGCRKLDSSAYSSRDCEILVTVEFAPLTGTTSHRTKGTITSRRPKTDPLYFDDMIMTSSNYYAEESALSIWRMRMEITMVLISNTLTCIFVALQTLHVKRNPEVPSFVSILMLLIVSAGNMIHLVLNFEVAYLSTYSVEQSEFTQLGGRLEVNEVGVRLSFLAALLLQICLLQLVCTAKQRGDNGKSSWIGEKKAGYVSLVLYISGVVLAFLLNRTSMNGGKTKNDGNWGGLMCYGGVFMDGFLLPQVLLNAFRGSAVKALCHPFYMGMSALRLAPHAYNQYRGHKYGVFEVKRTYYYADPAAGFYYGAWDFIIPFGILMLALILFLQQRGGQRRRFTFLLKHYKIQNGLRMKLNQEAV